MALRSGYLLGATGLWWWCVVIDVVVCWWMGDRYLRGPWLI
ncbi:hypothetical protein [Saccharopolyspora sp. ASAGF58]|nr:hypothetical protein [Saccharopolyspora sp. ASAGF58]